MSNKTSDKNVVEYKVELNRNKSIETLKEALNKIEIRGEQLYLLKQAIKYVLAEREQDKKRIKALERKIYDYDEIIARLEEKNAEKDKIIDEMAGYIAIIQDCPNENCGTNLDCKNRCTSDDSLYEECWKRYFKEKVNKER